MVALMKMNFPVELASASTTDDYIQEVIDALPYSGYWRDILRNMLWMDEDRRWDFRQIWSHLNPAAIPQIPVYHNDIPTVLPQPTSPALPPPPAPASPLSKTATMAAKSAKSLFPLSVFAAKARLTNTAIQRFAK